MLPGPSTAPAPEGKASLPPAPTPLVEAVPNVSEGRRADVLQELAAAAGGVRGAHLLDWSADPSHNRSVFTMAGSANDLAAAVLRLFAVAVEHVDLRRHRGEHPRIGAVDVVPFVPLGETSMDDCVDLARRVGREVADRLGIPVFWYEEAAVHESRRPLEAIRRGQFEGLSAKMHAPGWSPDCGPATPHPSAGASAVGARAPLIAFNVNLTTDDVAAARRIAGKIRERDGGLPGVKALGIRLGHRGIAQVSTNVVDYRRSSLETVLEAVLREAADLGVEVGGTELVGLVPAEALPAAGAERLRIDGFTPDRVLDVRLHRAAAGSPAPDGPR
ncbi:MAG: glutamate formimidoyltransferase [Acidobacteria bacterium]|nr:glutamate formimidoyltransferase [Acidobacteriota bacterium]